MLLGIKNTLDWFNDTGFAHWVIYYKGAEKGGQPVFKFDSEEEQTQIDALDRLRKALHMLDRGSYAIMAMSKQGASGRGAQKINFEISANHNAEPIGAMPAPVINGLSEDEVNRKITEAIQQYQTKVELEALRAENALLKKQVAENEKSDPLNAIIGHIGPYMPEMLGLTKAGIAGMPVPAPRMQMTMDIESAGGYDEAIAGPTISDEEHERLSNVISVFVAASPEEWLTILEKMAAKVQSQPSILQTIKMFL